MANSIPANLTDPCIKLVYDVLAAAIDRGARSVEFRLRHSETLHLYYDKCEVPAPPGILTTGIWGCLELFQSAAVAMHVLGEPYALSSEGERGEGFKFERNEYQDLRGELTSVASRVQRALNALNES